MSPVLLPTGSTFLSRRVASIHADLVQLSYVFGAYVLTASFRLAFFLDTDNYYAHVFDAFHIVLAIFFLFSLVFKDAIWEKSYGKMYAGLEVRLADGSLLSRRQRVIRNIFLLLPVEWIVTLIFQRKRIGDMVLKSEVVLCQRETTMKTQTEYGYILFGFYIIGVLSASLIQIIDNCLS